MLFDFVLLTLNYVEISPNVEMTMSNKTIIIIHGAAMNLVQLTIIIIQKILQSLGNS